MLTVFAVVFGFVSFVWLASVARFVYLTYQTKEWALLQRGLMWAGLDVTLVCTAVLIYLKFFH